MPRSTTMAASSMSMVISTISTSIGSFSPSLAPHCCIEFGPGDHAIVVPVKSVECCVDNGSPWGANCWRGSICHRWCCIGHGRRSVGCSRCGHSHGCCSHGCHGCCVCGCRRLHGHRCHGGSIGDRHSRCCISDGRCCVGCWRSSHGGGWLCRHRCRSCVSHGPRHAVCGSWCHVGGGWSIGGSRSLHGVGDPWSGRAVCRSRCHVGGGCSWRCVGGCSGLHGISDRRSWRAVGGSRCHVGGSRSRCGVGDGGRLCSVGDRCSRCSICDSRGLHSRHYCCWSSVSDSWCLCHRWCRSSVGHSRSLHWRCVCDRCCNFNRGGCIGRCRCRIRDGRCRRRCVSHLRCCICGGNWLGWSCCWHRVCGGRSCIGCSRHKRSHRRCCNCGWSCICHCRCHGWCCIGHSWGCVGRRHYWSRGGGRVGHGWSSISHSWCCGTTHRCVEL
mmetsp:Transcript_147807/g.411629  ORF Transcript_147807/g.411629 Transcript_147807/m.411629 type:complete len:442 (+) Transcript_147807:202-1527(+)